jgi:hypothetical protein
MMRGLIFLLWAKMTGSFWAGWPQMAVLITVKFNTKPDIKAFWNFGIKNA